MRQQIDYIQRYENAEFKDKASFINALKLDNTGSTLDAEKKLELLSLMIIFKYHRHNDNKKAQNICLELMEKFCNQNKLAPSFDDCMMFVKNQGVIKSAFPKSLEIVISSLSGKNQVQLLGFMNVHNAMIKLNRTHYLTTEFTEKSTIALDDARKCIATTIEIINYVNKQLPLQLTTKSPTQAGFSVYDSCPSLPADFYMRALWNQYCNLPDVIAKHPLTDNEKNWRAYLTCGEHPFVEYFVGTGDAVKAIKSASSEDFLLSPLDAVKFLGNIPFETYIEKNFIGQYSHKDNYQDLVEIVKQHTNDLTQKKGSKLSPLVHGNLFQPGTGNDSEQVSPSQKSSGPTEPKG